MDGGGPLLVEWPERIQSILPEERLWIALSWVEESRRRLYFTAMGEHYEGLLREYRRKAFGG
jgi:tRNA A37 threonylcarbamoyladenosine biosynthesis protein TsaE